jgi:hypothetical protein
MVDIAATRITTKRAQPIAIQTPSINDLLANPGAVGHTVQNTLATPTVATATPVGPVTLPQAVPLTGRPNNPPTPISSNVPGLNTPAIGATSAMHKHWMWIVLILIAVVGIWYFYSGSSTATA